jgi:hypothetical protein
MSKIKYKRFLFVDSEKVSRTDGSLDTMQFKLDVNNDNINNVYAMNLESFIVPSTFILFDEQDVADGNDPDCNKIIIKPTIYKPIVINSAFHDEACNDVTNSIQEHNINIDISVPWYHIDDTNRTIIVKKTKTISLDNTQNIYPNTELNNYYKILVIHCKLAESFLEQELIVFLLKPLTFLALVKSVPPNTRSPAMNISMSVLETNIETFENDKSEENAENILDSMYAILNQITKEKKTAMTQNSNREVVDLFTLTLKKGVYTKKSLLYEINAQQMLIKDPIMRNVCFEVVDDGTSIPYLQLNVNGRDCDGDDTTIQLVNNKHELQSLRKRFIRFEFKELSTESTHQMKVPIPEKSNDLRLEREVMNRKYFFLNTNTQSLEGDTTLPFRKQIEMTINDINNTTFFERVPWATTDFEFTVDIVATEVLDDIEIAFVGNYNIDDVEQHIQEGIRPLKDLSFSIDRNTLKSSFTLREDTEYIHDIELKLGSKVAKLLGYNKLSSNFFCDICNPLHESQSGFNAIKHKYLYLCAIANTNTSRINTIMNVYNNENNDLTKILGIIYLPEGPYGLNMMQHATLVGNNRVLFKNKVDITTIDISLRTPEGTLVRLNGQQIFFVLSFEVNE